MRSVEERFEANVDRRGEHELWLGTCDTDGTPQIRVDGRLTTARRVAWELARGPLPPKVTVAACETDPRCVRVEHLSLGRRRRRTPLPASGPPPRRHPKGGGTVREVNDGVWELAITAVNGSGRRYRRIHGTREDATAALGAFAVELGRPAATVDELIRGYLAHLQSARRSPATLRRYRQLWRQWLAADLGQLEPASLTRTRLERTLRHMAVAGQSSSSVHQAAVVLSGCLSWANEQGQLRRNPALNLWFPDGTRLAPPRHDTDDTGQIAGSTEAFRLRESWFSSRRQ